MPDPSDSCWDCTEWVEIWLDNSTNFILDAGGNNNSLSLNSSGFFVLTEDKATFLDSWNVDEAMLKDGKMSLNNNGDCVVLYKDGSPIDSFCYTSSKKNISWIRCENGWIERENATPGKENLCPTTDDRSLEWPSILYWQFNPSNPVINDIVNFSVVIENNRSETINVSIFIIVEKLGVEIFCGELKLLNFTKNSTNCSWVVPDNLVTKNVGKFEVYPEINFNGSKKLGESKIIVLCGIEDLGDPYIIVEYPLESVRFGDFAHVIVRLYTGNKNFSMRIISYIYKPRWISMDLDGNTIHSHLNDTKTALLLKHNERGENITLYIPLLIKSNCRGEYSEGLYTGRVRVYLEGTDEIVMEDKFNINVIGKNPLFCLECLECQKTHCDCNNQYSTNWNDDVHNKILNESRNNERLLIKLISYEKIVSVGSVFKTIVNVENTLNVTENFSLYSYVFNKSVCVSVGFDGKFWKNAWDANKKTVKISNGSSLNITLENMVENESISGDYQLRIRLKCGDYRKDLTRHITVTAPEKNSSIVLVHSKLNATKSVLTDSKKHVGAAVTEHNSDISFFFSTIFKDIAIWFISIFKF